MKLKKPSIYDHFDSVYILAEYENGSMNGRYKIGFSSGKTENRIRSYKAGNSRLVKELYTVLVPQKQGKIIEGKIHREFAANGIGDQGAGIEWFKLTMEELQKVILFMFQFESRKNVQVPQFACDPTAHPEKKITFDRSGFTPDMIPVFREDRKQSRKALILTDPFNEYESKGGLKERMKHAEVMRPIRYLNFTEH